MGNVSPQSTSEFNFGYDPEASHIVLREMKCEKILIPWEVFALESNKASLYCYLIMYKLQQLVHCRKHSTFMLI
jgi:hypothetical protein